MSMIGRYKRIKENDLKDLLENPKALSDFLYDETEENGLDIDKTWHIIHFLLNGETWEGNYPFSQIVLGGQPLNDEDLGYGPARLLTPEVVRKVSNAVSEISIGDLLKKYSPEEIKAADIYPGSWQLMEDDAEYIAANYKDLTDFFKTAADRDEAVIVWIG